MDKKTLRQYRALKNEIRKLDAAIEHLRQQQEKVPYLMGKVQSSEKQFPYIQEEIPVEIKTPKTDSRIRDLIRLKERRRQKAIDTVLAIEEYIGSIEDSTNRQIFEMVYIDGKTYRTVGKELNMEWSTIGKRIKTQLSA